jgi:hypothetical protein
MAWVWVVLSLFVLWTLGISLMRHEATPRALWFLARAVRPAARYFPLQHWKPIRSMSF